MDIKKNNKCNAVFLVRLNFDFETEMIPQNVLKKSTEHDI